MVVKLFGASGAHFGWMVEGDVFDAGYQPIAFPDGDDLYSFSRIWLGTYDERAVYDRTGTVVAIALGHPPLRTIPSRLGRRPPRISPLPIALPQSMRHKNEGGLVSNSERWEGLSMAEWLAQRDV
ncbi:MULTISPECIES: 4-fold beta flower protein [Stenotrophomonas maltophilia group]|uniref:4-fold beta flower protein n=1 Tax=Stenotrophomonas maltophilia group TaxID=995085 RepID=UPI003CE5913D